MYKIEEVLITKNDNGSITLTDYIDNQRIQKTYYDYNIKECELMFEEMIKNL